MEFARMGGQDGQLSFGLADGQEPAQARFEALRAEALGCRNCPLWEPATQTVFGEGPLTAPVVLIGEQPGDKEDLGGRPFIGPAGQKLDQALRDAGVDRGAVYVTNAVKHFKFVPRGKIRLHQKPATPEIKACKPWLERELAILQPKLTVAMGATAAHSLFGKATPVNKSRGVVADFNSGKSLVTIHPSYLLRIEDPAQISVEYDRFVNDLALLKPFFTSS